MATRKRQTAADRDAAAKPEAVDADIIIEHAPQQDAKTTAGSDDSAAATATTAKAKHQAGSHFAIAALGLALLSLAGSGGLGVLAFQYWQQQNAQHENLLNRLDGLESRLAALHAAQQNTSDATSRLNKLDTAMQQLAETFTSTRDSAAKERTLLAGRLDSLTSETAAMAKAAQAPASSGSSPGPAGLAAPAGLDQFALLLDDPATFGTAQSAWDDLAAMAAPQIAADWPDAETARRFAELLAAPPVSRKMLQDQLERLAAKLAATNASPPVAIQSVDDNSMLGQLFGWASGFIRLERRMTPADDSSGGASRPDAAAASAMLEQAVGLTAKGQLAESLLLLETAPLNDVVISGLDAWLASARQRLAAEDLLGKWRDAARDDAHNSGGAG